MLAADTCVSFARRQRGEQVVTRVGVLDEIFYLVWTCNKFSLSSRHELNLLPFIAPPFSWFCFEEALQISFENIYRWLSHSLERIFKLKGNFRGALGVKGVKIPAFPLAPFILSGALQPSDFDGLLNLSLFLLITTFQWGHKVHICHVYFQVTGFPSTLLSWPNVCVHGLNNCWGRFYFAGETFGLSEENVEVGDHKHPCASTVSHTCITQGSHYLQSLSPPTCDTTQT